MRQPTESEKASIASLLDLSMEDLYQEVGMAQAAYEGSFFSPAEAANEGKRFLESVRKPLYDKVCVEWHFCEHKDEPAYSDTSTLICAIADAILGLCGHIPPATIAVILFKFGIARFCECGQQHG